jgi:23S rRNA (adenine2503-C2)-methyltransferase
MAGTINLKSLSHEEIFWFIENLGLPPYRARQLLHWIYKRQAATLDEITVLSKELRNTLSACSSISNVRLIKRLTSSDGTEKYLFALEDAQAIESVLIQDKDRITLCISSQVGCALGCRFCNTGKLGLIRNLKSHEIVDQIIGVQRIINPDRRITHIVLMGMGEPLVNFDAVVEALWRMVTFIGISKRRITLSTAGIVPKFPLLSEKAPEINLAVSLNASSDATRSMLMPINKKYPIASLMRACTRFPLSPRRRITFEYVLIDGINDSLADAERLVGLLKGLRCKVNLIPLNPVKGGRQKQPAEKKIQAFQKVLTQNNLTALIRKSKGQDIHAACGQLRSTLISE